MSTIGWTVPQWVEAQTASGPEAAFSRLSELVASFSKDDPAWISLATPEILRKQWETLQSRPNAEKLPLYAVPVAVKDNIDALGFETTAACPAFAYPAKADATTVALLKKAGAIVVGKTNLDQFATGLVGVRSPYGITPNTFDPECVSGGSSAGSGSVVARGLVPLALGTDTAGSGRVPASLNNVVGLKPTRGVFSCVGVVPACKSLDCVSVFALGLADAQLAFSIMAAHDTADEYSRKFPAAPRRKLPTRPVLAVPQNPEWFGETENPAAWEAALSALSASGVIVKPVSFALLQKLALCLYEGPWVAERYAAVREFLASHSAEDCDATVYGIIKSAEKFSAADAFDYEYLRQRILREVEAEFGSFDGFVVPTCPLFPKIADVLAEPVKINSQQGTWTNFVNLADMAALAVPAGFRSDGLPFGITFIGPKFTDYALLDVAQRFIDSASASGSLTRKLGATKLPLPQSLDKLNPELPQTPSSAYVKLAVVGAHLSGMPLHHQLEEADAVFVQETKTSPHYQLFHLPNTMPAKPGLRRLPQKADGSTEVGHAIVVEVYAVPYEKFGSFVAKVPAPLGIGSVELADGEWVKGFICEEAGYASEPSAVEVSQFGSWRSYTDSTKPKKPFNTVLVANRGEIAVRIMKTLKKLGIRSVAVYSDGDKYTQHVEIADEAVPLHGTSAAETYLSIEKIIAAAKATKTEAIIPGYGFLSENADFADKCEAEGIVFVGPTGDAIRKLGLKHSAREIAEAASVPLVPGSGLVATEEEAFAAAEKISYPLMVKSTAGGGGIGLQKVDSPAELSRAFRTVQHQGKAYFGDDGVFLERFVENARHVEVQMFGDGKGKAVALGERDCSLQRRNQKIIEETPAPNLPAQTRAAMRKAAEQLGAKMHYRCAGTVEFIYDEPRDEFYFLEVNARLQVEHPVTELVTGLDLVEWMLLIAAGTPPAFTPPPVVGASMEARLYAENPVRDFQPSPGQLTQVDFPSWARVDTWVTKGTEITTDFDPTLAKIIVHGETREEALQKLQKALAETAVHGVATNIEYLRAIAGSDMFSEARMTTKTLDTFPFVSPSFEITEAGSYTTVQDYPGRIKLWRIGVPPSGPMDDYAFRLANRAVGNDPRAPALECTLNGPDLRFHTDSVVCVTGGSCSLTIDGKAVPMWEPLAVKAGETVSLGKLTSGCRAYVAVRGGIDVPEYLGSRATFALGKLGGFNGRTLKRGDVLFLGRSGVAACTLPPPVAEPAAVPDSLRPKYGSQWDVAVTCGPHGGPDFFTEESVKNLLAAEWKVHYNSNRFGVRLIGPKPEWARKDGGEAGLHPSNAHDYVYALGALNFTGDEPVILTCDGPSLGGFVCAAVVVQAEMWKIGQVKPGDIIRFRPVSCATAIALRKEQDKNVAELCGSAHNGVAESLQLPQPENPILYAAPATAEHPKVTYRQAGDRYILVEYGDNVMDLNLAYRVRRLSEKVTDSGVVGVQEMSPGVRSVLIEYDGTEVAQSELLKQLVGFEQEILFDKKWSVPSRVLRLPMAFEDKKTLAAVQRYAETIRSTAPWLPNNVDFIASVNGVSRDYVHDMLYSARFLVLGLGDVFLGAPCAVPLDPRHRLLGTKYNPSRTYTPNGTVGIGGMYMCIYAMESPGGYQLVGRTVPIWDKLTLGPQGRPWLLDVFDQVEFYPVSEEELDVLCAETEHGKFPIEIVDSVFDHGAYLQWVERNIESITEFTEAQGSELEEFNRLIQISNAELQKGNSGPEQVSADDFGDNAVFVYSEFTGRFWKPVAEVGETVSAGQGLIVVEAMKTEMVVSAPEAGKVVKIVHGNGDMVEAGDLVAVLEKA